MIRILFRRNIVKKTFKRFLVVMIAVLAIMAFGAQSLFAQAAIESQAVLGKYFGKTVILHSNDVHGAIAGYANMAQLAKDFEAEGAEVLIVDAGDFFQGTTYVSASQGLDSVTMMNAVGYDVAGLGNHEFDYGYAVMKENLAKADFQIVCANIFEGEKTIYEPYWIYTNRDGKKIAFLGLDTPEVQTKANPALIKGLSFPMGKELYSCAQAQIDELHDKADFIVCLSHLGVDESSVPNRSLELYANTKGLDFVIDGHSHTVMFEGPDGEPIQSTGTAFANIGVIIIDNYAMKVENHYLQPVSHKNEAGEKVQDVAADPLVSSYAQEIMDRINGEYGKVFAQNLVELCGDKEPGNRTQETNLGDLITDAMVWTLMKNPGSLEVADDHVVAITNGGGIRAWIHAGSVSRKDVNTVLPFGNTIAVVYVKGSQLLEALEASTFCTPISIGGFPQTKGMKITVDTTKAYDKADATYPASTYFGPKTINRVKIESVNGKPFDPNATYAVITNNFVAAGGDTYHAFADAANAFDTGLALDEAVMDYITSQLNGVISEKYATPQGRMTVLLEQDKKTGKITIGGLDSDIWFTKYGNVYMDIKVSDFMKLGFAEGDMVRVKFLDNDLVMPVIPTYSYVDQGTAAIIAPLGENGQPTGYLSMAINMGNFAKAYGLATKTTNADKTWFWTAFDGVTFPVEIKFEMAEKEGYLAEYILHDLSRTNNRADYAGLSDEQFANFRPVTTTGMGDDRLFRTSSPVNPEIGRNIYADAAIAKAKVTVIMNLSDDKASAAAYAGFADSYYSKQKVIYLNLGVDFQADDFKKGLAEGMRFFISNPGVYAVHCTEGKDRAGFVSALLECLMGASFEQVRSDYMTTYFNYYGVEKGTEKYNAIAASNIEKSLKAAFGVADLNTADLAAKAEAYLSDIGLGKDEIVTLKANLAR